MIPLIKFVLRARFGHFLRAEAGANALSYPIPPRTSILGLVGAVLGLPKDTVQEVLEPAKIALSGKWPLTHWHRAKLRKDPPEALPESIKARTKEEKKTKPETATLINQEWLFNPEYTIWIGLPEPYHSDLEQRLKERRWHFQPCMGLSEMMADLEYIDSTVAESLPDGSYHVCSVVRYEKIEIDVTKILKEVLALNMLKLPCLVNPQRVFSHAAYISEKSAKAIPVRTQSGGKKVYQAGEKVLMFL